MLIADMAQSVERRLGKAEVTGSIPVISLNMQSAVHYVQHFFGVYKNMKSVSCQSSLLEIINGKN